MLKNLIFSTDIYHGLALSKSFIKDINTGDYYDINVTDIETALIDKVQPLIEDSIDTENPASKDTLFVISKGYVTGGHTRLMENLGLMLPKACALLITRQTDDEVVTKFYEYFDTVIKCFNNDDGLNHIKQIAHIIQSYSKVVLNTHPDDIHTIIACALAKKFNKRLQVYFVNHADHLASYGVTVADVWFEISLCGQQLDKDRGFSDTLKTSFLGIPINKEKSQFFTPVDYHYNPQGMKFLTAASAHKYYPIDGDSIVPLIQQLLSLNNNNQMTLIGSKIQTNPIFLNLKKRYQRRLQFYSSLPHHEYMSLTQNTDFYVDSYPMPGGTAFVEQFIAGKPCIGLCTNFYGYTPLDLIKTNSVDELVALLIDKPPTEKFVNDLQAKIFEVHGFERVKERFLAALYKDCYFNNPMAQYMLQTPVIKNQQLYISSATIKKIFAINKTVFFKLLSKKVAHTL